MQIDIISIFPEMFHGFLTESIIKRAVNSNLVAINIHNLRDYSVMKHKNVDDYPYGGGAGMVMMIEPIARCIETLQGQCKYDEIIFLTPDGEIFNQAIANKISLYKNVILLCGHYKGIDERVREKFVTLELSIGDYVLTGGELAAAVVCDAVVRLIPGAINDGMSMLTDSFQENLLSPPVYTRPSEYKGMKVPNILLSGNEAEINKWRHKMAVERTKARRPDLHDKYISA